MSKSRTRTLRAIFEGRTGFDSSQRKEERKSAIYKHNWRRFKKSLRRA